MLISIPDNVATILYSLGLSAAGAWTIVQISWQGTVRKKVETYLGDRAAEREYVLEARKRLYVAIGPLRFQLLMACRDLVGRLCAHAEKQYGMALSGPYGRSTLYRLLRPIAIASLIERKVAIADFSVDPSAVALVRFGYAVKSALSEKLPILGHPDQNWNYQEQHLFRDNISLAASILINTDSDEPVLIEYADFEQRIKDENFASRLKNIPTILDDFRITEKPLLWARFVCYGYICNRYLEEAGSKIGFSTRPYNVAELVSLSGDPYFEERLPEFDRACRTIFESSL